MAEARASILDSAVPVASRWTPIAVMNPTPSTKHSRTSEPSMRGAIMTASPGGRIRSKASVYPDATTSIVASDQSTGRPGMTSSGMRRQAMSASAAASRSDAVNPSASA